MRSALSEPACTLPARGRSHRGHVLIVDDESANRTLLRDPLEAYGYTIAEAQDGAEAIHAVNERLPDAILLDVMMPGMDGFQVCRSLKQCARTAHVPVLIITALSERRERLLGIEAGANDFLTKPVDIQEVALRVGNAVYTKSLFDQLSSERDKSERLLYNTLPRPIAERMKRGELNIADVHPEVTLLMADLAGFSALTSHIAPDEVVALLNEVFSKFDILTAGRRLEKIKTIGDTYLAAGGLPEFRSDHAQAIAELALDMREAMEELNREYHTSITFRIGIGTGLAIAGVIGRKNRAYDVWGEALNTARALQASTEPGMIEVCEETYQQLKDRYQFADVRRADLGDGCVLAGYRLVDRRK